MLQDESLEVLLGAVLILSRFLCIGLLVSRFYVTFGVEGVQRNAAAFVVLYLGSPYCQRHVVGFRRLRQLS